MVFSNDTTKQGLIQDIDFLLFGTSAVFNTDYSLLDRTRNLNIVWDEAVAEMFKADPNFEFDDTTNTDFPVATIALGSGLDHYTMPDSSLVIHRVRAKDKSGEFKTLHPVLKSELDDDELEAVGEPEKYYKIGNAVFPVPIPDYGFAAGFELEFQRGGNHFVSTDTTKEPGFNPQFHRFLTYGAALDYAGGNGLQKKMSYLSTQKEAMRSKMIEHYQLRSPDMRPQLRLKRGNPGRFAL